MEIDVVRFSEEVLSTRPPDDLNDPDDVKLRGVPGASVIGESVTDFLPELRVKSNGSVNAKDVDL